MLQSYFLTLIFLLSLLTSTVFGLFFGALGAGCGCMPSCCAITLPSISFCGCPQPCCCCPSLGSSCAASSGCQSGGGGGSSCSSGSGGGGGGGGCGSAPPFGGGLGQRSSPSYVLPPGLTLPTFAPQLPQQPLYSTAPQENSSGASPSYSPPPAPSTSNSYTEDLNDNVEKPKVGNEITGIDTFDKMVKPGGSNSDLYDEKVPDVADYGDTSNRSGKGGGGSKKSDLLPEYSDNNLMTAADQDNTGDPKCSSETLRIIMQENIVSSPTISKQLIFSAGRLAFGQTIDVICSRNKFSYTVVSSKIFCEASRGRIT